MDKTMSTFRISCLFIMALIIALGVSSTNTYADTYQYTIEAGSYEIVDAGNGYQEIIMEGFGQLFDPGKPRLPSKIFTIAIPPGASVVSVTVEETDAQRLPGVYNILPVPSPMPGNGDDELIKEAMDLYERNYQATYSSDAPYPEERGALISQGGYRKYNIVNVRFTPFDYRPQSGELYLISWATVIIEYSLDAAAETRDDLLLENLPEVEEKAKEILDNYEDTQSWYPLTGEEPGGLYEFVIVTTDDLVDAVQPLVDWERSKGRTVYVATTTWINANYSGADLQRRIRYFLRDKYPSAEWGILKVCLVGNLTDVPMRYCDVRKTGSTNTATLTPTDYYYAELTSNDSASWDDDWDGFFGERGDDTIDFITEVDVGRIPWSDPAIVESICTKMANYENSTYTAYKKNVLLPKAFWDEDTDNAVLAQKMWNDFYNGAGYTRWRIYEYGPTFYSTYTRDATLTHTNVIDDWNGDEFGSVCWSGHGSSSSVSYNAHHGWMTVIQASDYTSLDDDYPSVIYSNSCSTAYPEVASLGRNMMRSRGVAFVGSTRVMWYMPGWDELSDGWGNTLAYLFSQKSRYGGGSSIGYSHTQALRNMYTTYGWDSSDDGWVSMFEYVLYGNPDLWIRARPGLPNLDYYFRTGWDYPLVPRSAAGATSTWCPVTSTLPGNTSDTYFNWTCENNGSVTSPSGRWYKFIDGRWMCYSGTPLAPGESKYNSNWNYGPTISGGRHTLYYHLDEDEEIWETNESDNCWGHQFVWSPYYLSDDTPINRGAPPDGDAWGCASAPHYYNNDGFSFYVNNSGTNKWWSAVGIMPYNASADYDMRLWDIGDYTGSEQGFGAGHLEWSGSGPGVSDFVIVNRNVDSPGTYYTGVINANNQTGNFHIEEATSTKIFAGTNGPYSRSSTAVLDIYEYYMNAGDYGIKLEQTAGTCDLGMSLYDDETAHCQKSEYMTGGYANSGGDGGDEYMEVTIPDAGYHGLAVWKADSSDYPKTTTYKIKVGQCATPDTPSNPSPVDGATDVSVDTDLNWDDCDYSEYYEVWLRENYGTWIKLGETETSAWALPTLNEATYYEWFIAANNICGTRVYVYWDFTTEDNTAPTPNPMTWATEPYGASTSSISMVATTATDDTPPVQYYFLCVTADGNSSGWQTSTSYTDSVLPPNTWCGYRVMARDSATPPNQTAYSSGSRYAYTLANLPGADGFSNITQTSIRANWTANGNPAGTQYYCENTTEGTNSGWTTNTYWTSTGLTCGTSYSFRVKARNGDGVDTTFTSLGSQSTLACDYEPPVIDDIAFDDCISECPSCPDSAISVTAHDPEGGGLSYTYATLDGGTIIGTGANVAFDPPDAGPHPCPYRVEVTVKSSKTGLTAAKKTGIYVKLTGDVDGNGVVNVLDKVQVRNHFGESGTPGWIDADVDCNGVVNVLDKVKVRNQFGQTGCDCP